MKDLDMSILYKFLRMSVQTCSCNSWGSKSEMQLIVKIYRGPEFISVFIASVFCCDNKRSCITFYGRDRKIFLPLSDKTQAAKKYERKESFSQHESAG